MFLLSLEEVLTAVSGRAISGKTDGTVSGVSTDSRKISENQLFIPLKGEKFDGHDYIETALKSGAAAVLTHKDMEAVEGKTIIRVEDTSRALRELAAYYRRKFRIPFIAITGSVGKTSTKDMIACAAGQKYKVLKTEGNFNNEIGLPLTIFRLDGTHEAAVLEMGMSGFGEISRLTAIVRPDIAVITNIGLSHVEKLGSRQNILRAKLEILEGLREGGLVILNGDDGLLRGAAGLIGKRHVLYGLEEKVDYRAYGIVSYGEKGVSFNIMLDGREHAVSVPAPGVHNVYNALAAIAAGRELGIPVGMIINGIAQFSSGKMRMNVIEANGLKVINDTYNASPQSMEAAISVLDEMDTQGRKYAVLGDMLEMGDWAKDAHIGVGRFAAGKRLDGIVTVGTNAKHIAVGAVDAGFLGNSVDSFSSNEEACRFLKTWLNAGDIVLVKGSRGMHMEEIVDCLTEEDESALPTHLKDGSALPIHFKNEGSLSE